MEKDLSTPISSSRDSSVAPCNSSRSLRLGIAGIGMEDQWLLLALVTAKATGALPQRDICLNVITVIRSSECESGCPTVALAGSGWRSLKLTGDRRGNELMGWGR